MKQKLISMTEKEITRHNIIQNLIDGKINGIDASKQIQVSTRQIRRIKAKLKKGSSGNNSWQQRQGKQQKDRY